MEQQELLTVLNDIRNSIKTNNGCKYHREFEERVNKLITKTQLIKLEKEEQAKRLGDVLTRLEQRLDAGDRSFDKLKSDIQEIKEDIVELKTRGKISADWIARALSIIVIAIMALQLLHSIISGG